MTTNHGITVAASAVVRDAGVASSMAVTRAEQGTVRNSNSDKQERFEKKKRVRRTGFCSAFGGSFSLLVTYRIATRASTLSPRGVGHRIMRRSI